MSAKIKGLLKKSLKNRKFLKYAYNKRVAKKMDVSIERNKVRNGGFSEVLYFVQNLRIKVKYAI